MKSQETLNVLEALYNEDETDLISCILKEDFPRTLSNEETLKNYENPKLRECINSLWNETDSSSTSDTQIENNSSSISNTSIVNNSETFSENQYSSSTVNTTLLTRLENLEMRVRKLEEENNILRSLTCGNRPQVNLRNQVSLTRENRVTRNGSEPGLYLHLADPSYERDYLPIMETILCDAYQVDNPEDIYQEKKVHRYGEIDASSSSSNTLPPPGSIVLYVLFLTSNRFDDFPKKQFLATLIRRQVNVIVCLFRRARGSYLDVEEIVAGNGIPVQTIPFMTNQKRLSHEVSDLSTKEKDSLVPGYAKSLINLKIELGLSEPKSKNRKLFKL